MLPIFCSWWNFFLNHNLHSKGCCNNYHPLVFKFQLAIMSFLPKLLYHVAKSCVFCEKMNFKKIYKPMRNIRPWVMALTAVDSSRVTQSEWEAELPQFWREEHLKPPTKRSCDLSGSDGALSLSVFWSDQRSDLSPCTLLFASSPTHTHTPLIDSVTQIPHQCCIGIISALPRTLHSTVRRVCMVTHMQVRKRDSIFNINKQGFIPNKWL